jgi:hypothetical protein
MIHHKINFKLDSARRGWSALGVVCFIGLLAAGCDHRGVPLNRAVPVEMTQPTDPKVMESAIEMSLARRHWTIKERAPGRYVAELAEKKHSATIAIVYDAQNARIDYVNSSNLMYENGAGGETIHRNYNNWVKNLANDIKVNAIQAGVASAPAPAAK